MDAATQFCLLHWKRKGHSCAVMTFQFHKGDAMPGLGLQDRVILYEMFAQAEPIFALQVQQLKFEGIAELAMAFGV